nr:protein glutamine dumper 2-like [Tanacetum cinerariifolium]
MAPSPWHTPVPYFFGGLAFVMGLIAFALLVLACSYWNLGHEDVESEGETDIEAGDSKLDKNLPSIYEEKYLVIMAGHSTPTFLATPVSSKPPLFCTCSCQSNVRDKSSTLEEETVSEGSEKEGSSSHVQETNPVNQEA